MHSKKILCSGVAAFVAVMALSSSARADITVGASGKTFASSALQCAVRYPTTDPAVYSPVVDAGLLNPTSKTSATVSMNSVVVSSVTATDPTAKVWLPDVDAVNKVVVALSKRTADTYQFTVNAGMCGSGNTFSADGTLEYAASLKSYATVMPGCAWNPGTGIAQPYINLFDNGSYLLNVSVNGIPLTQLSASRPHTPVFLRAGVNVITAVNGSLSTDYYVRDGGNGTCTLP
jgi:hypothetical protein